MTSGKKTSNNSVSLKEAKKSWLKYRWEFMRRDPEYIRAYNEITELAGKAHNQTGHHIENIETILADKIKEYCKALELFMPILLDPNKSFEELNEINYEADSPGLNQAVFHTIHDQQPVKIYSQYGGEDIPKGILLLEIDFDRVNSIDALKKTVIDKIDFYWKNDYLQRLPQRIKVNKVNFERILQVGDLKRSLPRLSWKEIASETFPDDSDSDSAIMKAKQHYSRYEELINGGWRNLKFP